MSRGHHGEGCDVCAMLLSAAGAELSSTAAVGLHSANLGLRQRTSTAVLAATDPNLLIYGSTAVGKGTSYCCRPAIQEVGVCGGAYSSGCTLSQT